MSDSMLREALQAAVDRGVAAWQEGHCQEVECGCVAEYVKKEIRAVFASHQCTCANNPKNSWPNLPHDSTCRLASQGSQAALIPDTEEGLSSEQLAERWPGEASRRSQVNTADPMNGT